MKACKENGHIISDHFVQSSKVIMRGKGAKQNVMDILLSRYAAYLVVMNGDPPPESIQQLQWREYTRLKQGAQPSIFDELDESERED